MVRGGSAPAVLATDAAAFLSSTTAHAPAAAFNAAANPSAASSITAACTPAAAAFATAAAKTAHLPGIITFHTATICTINLTLFLTPLLTQAGAAAIPDVHTLSHTCTHRSPTKAASLCTNALLTIPSAAHGITTRRA